MTNVQLLGGWGYNNLGDEAILAGYLDVLHEDVNLLISSANPIRTAQAQRLDLPVSREGKSASPLSRVSVLAGGGYLNGSWVPEVNFKLRRMRAVTKDTRVVAHAIEVRGFDGRFAQKQLGHVLSESETSVRDDDSSRELKRAIGVNSQVVPDAISLIYPTLENYITKVPDLEGKVLLNLLDIAGRPDSNEFELGLDGYRPFVHDLIKALGTRAVGLLIGDGDQQFMQEFPSLPLIAPSTVAGLVSCIEASDAMVSVRMHPSLIASALNKPVLAIPYCGKVRPTLTNIGVDSAILNSFNIERTMAGLELQVDRSEPWSTAHSTSREWLVSRIA